MKNLLAIIFLIFFISLVPTNLNARASCYQNWQLGHFDNLAVAAAATEACQNDWLCEAVVEIDFEIDEAANDAAWSWCCFWTPDTSCN